jgi:hypothetical protein
MSTLTIADIGNGLEVNDTPAYGLEVDTEGDLDMGSYDIGDGIKLTAHFTNDAGADANPTTVTCTVLLPDDSLDEATVTGPSPTGYYQAIITAEQNGKHFYRWAGTGAIVAAQEGRFTVRKRKVPAA